ncbi:MAG: pyrroline-5-carboxylate reductase [Deltaproteobacteria bacterium]|nr:MAG: pyrroline-5-carboxylate reductase [Deltaproteobacteria bacterium]
MSPQIKTVTFIGGGNMATAMVEGLESLDEPPSITLCDPSEAARQRHRRAGRRTVAGPAQLDRPRVIVLAFKPQHLAAAAPDLDACLPDDALVVSVLAGVSTQTLHACFPRARVVRVMPNTPMAIGQGMAGVAAGDRATPHDVETAAALCRPSGEVLIVPEARLDAITAVSGSGPAYFFRFCEVLVRAAREELDFSDAEARLLVSQTAKGAIAYLDSEEGFPAQRLRSEVTSPGGTTEAALRVFDQGGIAELAENALRAAAHRARELDAAASARMQRLDRGRVA